MDDLSRIPAEEAEIDRALAPFLEAALGLLIVIGLWRRSARVAGGLLMRSEPARHSRGTQ